MKPSLAAQSASRAATILNMRWREFIAGWAALYSSPRERNPESGCGGDRIAVLSRLLRQAHEGE